MYRKKSLALAVATIAFAMIGISTMRAWHETPTVDPAVSEGGGEKASPDETALRKTAADFAKAFNAGDAKALAAFWTKDGEFIGADGDEITGRAAIQKDFAEFFKTNPKASIEVKIESIRILGKHAALEEGTTRVILGGDDTPNVARYSVLHVREDDGWRMASVREWIPDAAELASLNDLAWLVGDWTAKGKEADARITYAWDEDKTTIRGRYVLTKDGKTTHSGTHILGKDPVRGLRAWVFDSTGIYGESFWWRDDNKWIIEATGTLPNGSEASSMNILVPISNDAFTWQSVDRVIAGSEVPDVSPVRVTRVKK